MIKFYFFSFFLFYSIIANSQGVLLRNEIEKIIRYEQPVDFNVVPGILVGVIDGDSTYRFSFGGNINAKGIFELGSLTKPVVAWLAYRALVLQGKNRDEKLCTYLPDSLCTDGWKYVTVDQVMEHKVGLPRISPGIGEIETDVSDPYKDYTSQLLARDMLLVHPSPGRYSYSHIGYAALDWLFEKTGGIEKITVEHLTELYDMHDTKWHVAPGQIEPGHGLDGRVQPPWNTNAYRTALGLKSSMDDMIKFMRILFTGYEKNRAGEDPKKLKRELKALGKSGAYKVVDGWFVVRSGKSLVFYHNGRTGGHHVSIAFTPQHKKGVIVISNGALGSNDLSLLILRMVNQAKKPRNS